MILFNNFDSIYSDSDFDFDPGSKINAQLSSFYQIWSEYFAKRKTSILLPKLDAQISIFTKPGLNTIQRETSN